MLGSQIKKDKMSQRYHSPFINNSSQSKALNVKTLIEDIKYMQTCFTAFQSKQIPSKYISLEKRKSSHTVKKKRHTSNFKEKSVNLEREKKQLNSNPIKGKQLKVVNPQNIQNKKRPLTQKCIQKDKKEAQNISNPSKYFVLLQMENLKLQKQNLFLQNQLLDQRLQKERQQKQQLKNHLNKLKIHFLRQKDIELPKYIYKHQTTQKKRLINGYLQKPSQINSIIPQFTTGNDFVNLQLNKARNQLQCSYSTAFQGISVKEVNMSEEYPDSLLISKSESFSKQSFKENQGTHQNKYCNLLGQCYNKQYHGKCQIRQVMGDIANKLKTIRKH